MQIKMEYYMKILLLFVLLLLISCNPSQEKLCVIDRDVRTLVDSTFLRDIKQLQIYNDTLYMLDGALGKVIKMDTHLVGSAIDFADSNHSSSSIIPVSIYVDGDSVYVMDANVRGIQSLSLKSKHGHITQLMGASGTRFFVDKNHFYVSYVTEQNCIMVVPEKALLNDTNVVFIGDNFHFSTANENRNRNIRYLLYDKKYYYAISDNQPIIEKYELGTNTLLHAFDFSDVPMVMANIHFIESQILDDSSYYVMIEDAYIYRNTIYLLCAKLGENYTRNTIIEVELEPNMYVSNIYKLPGKSYTSFCVYKSNIYAFNKENNSLERLKMGNK